MPHLGAYLPRFAGKSRYLAVVMSRALDVEKLSISYI
jgi:hypothetical protein